MKIVVEAAPLSKLGLHPKIFSCTCNARILTDMLKVGLSLSRMFDRIELHRCEERVAYVRVLVPCQLSFCLTATAGCLSSGQISSRGSGFSIEACPESSRRRRGHRCLAIGTQRSREDELRSMMPMDHPLQASVSVKHCFIHDSACTFSQLTFAVE